MLTAQPMDFTLGQDSVASFRCRCRARAESTASGRLANDGDGIDLYDAGRKATCVANADEGVVELNAALVSNIEAAKTAKRYSEVMLGFDNN